MKILIAGGISFLYQLRELSKKLNEHEIESKVVLDDDYVTDFPSKNIKGFFRTKKKFHKLISTFKPDVVLVDRPSKFALEIINSKIPLFLILRGHYWLQNEWNKKTIYKNWFLQKLLQIRFNIDKKVFDGATAILPLCEYLIDVVKEYHPQQNVSVFVEGIDSTNWEKYDGLKLNHPCVGLVQRAHHWAKSSEMLILKKVLPQMPLVHFYWAGGGTIEKEILDKLKQFQNFHWLGSLNYPGEVRKFLSEIDVYLLPTGMETTPLSLKEAQLMEKPVISTSVGGTPETMIDGTTGFLVEQGNENQMISKLNILLNDESKAKQMGKEGRKFIKKKFGFDSSVKNLLLILQSFQDK